MNKVILFFVFFSWCTFINAQKRNDSLQVKLEDFVSPIVTKDHIILPKYTTLVAKAKSKKAKNDKVYSIDCSGVSDKCYVIVSNKKNTEITTYRFTNKTISLIIKGKKDIQVYKRKAKNTGFTQEFSYGVNSQIDFYDDGNVHTIRQFGNCIKVSGYPVGTWYAYSKDGNIIQEINHDKHFKMTFYDVLEIADRYSYPYMSISRGFNEAFSYWDILVYPHYQDNTTVSRKILIDDSSRQVIYDIDQADEKYLLTKEYEKLKLDKNAIEWLRHNDQYQVPDNEFYNFFKK